MRVFRSFLTVILAATSLLAVAGCSPGEATSAAPAGSGTAAGRGGQQPPIPVTAAPVVQKSMPIEIKVIGTAEAYSTVAIRAQITGQLEKVNFAEGDDVMQGQVLFALDRRPLEAALQQAQANLERDQAQAANAAVQAKRFEDLAKRGIATREQVDTSQTGAAALNATVEADRAAVENAKVQLQYATITAPISGRTGALMVHEGNLVRANDTASLVTINQVSPVYVGFAVPEARLPELRKYMARGTLAVAAAPPNDDLAPASGRISFVDNSVDQTTGTIRIKATFPNLDRRLWPGQYVNVTVALSQEPNAIVVPTPAVQAGQQGPFVFVIKQDQTVELRQVTTGRANETETIIDKGLQPGETVVTDGHLRLLPGSRVTIKGADASKVTS
jgi:multidrug efflux system membrane fusion protein